MGRNKEVDVSSVYEDYNKLDLFSQLALLQKIEQDVAAKKEEKKKEYAALEQATNGKHQ